MEVRNVERKNETKTECNTQGVSKNPYHKLKEDTLGYFRPKNFNKPSA